MPLARPAVVIARPHPPGWCLRAKLRQPLPGPGQLAVSRTASSARRSAARSWQTASTAAASWSVVPTVRSPRRVLQL